MMSLDDTIAAIATPIGSGGVGIIKISGPEALPIIQYIFKPIRHTEHVSSTTKKNLVLVLKPRYLHYGQIIDPNTYRSLDEVLVAYMPAPHSYTCQDVVEIQGHGSLVALQQILQLTLSLGARLATAGEMTLRAFINGRLDLSQAEAVLDIINAKTEASLRIATQQLNGHLSNHISQVRQRLVDILAFLEASIDFVEDDIPAENVIPPLQEVWHDLKKLIDSATSGLIYRQGVRTAIVGQPNVGKSSLLNALLGDERAIVTDIPGTTRDTLEETANIRGLPLTLVDTAGIRHKPNDTVEKIGIERSRQALSQADLALMVVDYSKPLNPSDWEIAQLLVDKAAILVLNKQDIKPNRSLPENFLSNVPQVPISAQQNIGLADLEATIMDLVTEGHIITPDEALVSNPRHKALLIQATEHIQAAIEAHQSQQSPDLVSIDVRAGVDALGDITGENAAEDLLNTIFSKFCIGK